MLLIKEKDQNSNPNKGSLIGHPSHKGKKVCGAPTVKNLNILERLASSCMGRRLCCKN